MPFDKGNNKCLYTFCRDTGNKCRASRTPLNNCRLKFCDELFAIEGHPTVTSEECDKLPESPVKRRLQPDCTHCGDRPERKCRHCACCRCGGKEDPSRQLLCDECDRAFHLGCLDPPLEELPQEDTWFCPKCKTDTSRWCSRGGAEGLKAQGQAAICGPQGGQGLGTGHGLCGAHQRMHPCAPQPLRAPAQHPRGLLLEVSESGCHRPPVGGIHGRESDGAYSIVLSGGYEDDAVSARLNPA
ncbi:E3 ubiquitin ligase Np95, putative [Ixodes scapularis]|uniref:RING-type E3 ubiquitin transferase n=1 Tax=Ixodes scapularis TaxID=6945 RepID=B7PB87_IXOSC|nr:E3 ubiquitin ligase Np95, putative [Ixodes scapularis]|eukprot:XP_002407744.1 E3 ubiquitin ligase Np95, putative [Ixodes scapularis]